MQKKVKAAAVITVILVMVSLGAIAFFAWYMEYFTRTPADPKGSHITFSIESGESLSTISNNLFQHNIITNIQLFKLLVRFNGFSKRLQAGEYTLSASMPPEEILNILATGKVKLYKLTIPEGLNIEETAMLVEKAGFGPAKDFIDLARDKNIAGFMGIPGNTLEGYLYPETYFFSKKTTTQEIIKRMVQRFNAVVSPQWEIRARDLGFSMHQIVTLASIIEKETGDESERPLISSVFHNRLKKKMRLESDPTVIYGIPDFNGNLTKKNLQTWTPYNTYRISELPPGPIANPGEMSLKAALWPETTDYLFFVSKNDSTHKFSKSIEEHNKAVKKYQLRK